MGVNILKSIELLDDILPIIMYHHERYIGNGYPDMISGDSIPSFSRIISVADIYDAMTSNRPYREKFLHEVTVEEMLRNKQIQFDGRIVDAFLKIEKSLNNDSK
ncbi:HD-GYP domain-containing protein [Acetobacterium malicum]